MMQPNLHFTKESLRLQGGGGENILQGYKNGKGYEVRAIAQVQNDREVLQLHSGGEDLHSARPVTQMGTLGCLQCAMLWTRIHSHPPPPASTHPPTFQGPMSICQTSP